ncbi:sensor histidine kinase [Pedobacter sp. ASV28]|uniref:sensor histidine kinase n=1 Tax=Pedobacter sp. ASV28 TaxID=2795123 RepID=UPI001E618780|nr:sensor histidine kinase [Pedobacter sp. ASV28]
MKHMRYLAILAFFVVSFLFGATAQVVHLEHHFSNLNIGKQVTYYEDKKAVLKLADVIQLDGEGAFRKSNKDILNLSNTQSAFWIKIAFTSSTAMQDYLIVDIPNIENIDCYIPADTGFIALHAGSIRKSLPGVITSNNFVFPLPNFKERDAVHTLWLRVKTHNILLLPLKMMSSRDGDFNQNSIRISLEKIYIGMLLTLLIFNLFLYFSLKDRTYLYYCLYVFAFGVYVGCYLRGYGYLFGENFRIYLNQYPHFFVGIAIASSIQFSNNFFNLKAISPRISKVCNVIIILCLILMLLSLAGYKSITTIFTQLLSLFSPILLMLTGIIAYRKGNNTAKYYILAWSAISVTLIIMVLSMQGILEFRDYSFWFLPLGSTVELLFLAFALGNRYTNIINNEKKVREENYQLVQTQKQRLEKLVEGRTAKLKDTIAQLEESNAVKNKLFSIIAHDLRSPFNSLISIFTLKDMDMLSFEELKMLLNENKKNIDTIHNTINNLLYWAKGQMEGIGMEATEFDLKLLIDDLILVYSPLAQTKAVNIRLDINGDTLVYADENQIQLVMRNLIDNAVKFTVAGQNIVIDVEQIGDKLWVKVSNVIANVSEFNLEEVMSAKAYTVTTGTGNEKGIGLGMHLCKEYVKLNGGEFRGQVVGQIVSFYFYLPKSL